MSVAPADIGFCEGLAIPYKLSLKTTPAYPMSGGAGSRQARAVPAVNAKKCASQHAEGILLFRSCARRTTPMHSLPNILGHTRVPLHTFAQDCRVGGPPPSSTQDANRLTERSARQLPGAELLQKTCLQLLVAAENPPGASCRNRPHSSGYRSKKGPGFCVPG